jgi:Zn-dependent M28 family amino/carboxypeptidase
VFVNLKSNLESHLCFVTRLRDPYLSSAGHFFVQEYIRQQFTQWGSVDIHTFNFAAYSGKNLILNLPPKTNSEKRDLVPILIGAHYDSVPGSPGADDNATGVAVLLELARIFAAEPAKYPLRLVAFDMEECCPIGPGLLGSTSYATLLKEQGQQLRLMISLEMLGYCSKEANSQKYPSPLDKIYPNRGDFIALVGNLRTLKDLISLSRCIRSGGTPSQYLPVPNRGLIVKETRASDHSPFWDQGYPAMMITDTSFLRNPHYHKASDTIATLDLDFLTGVCQGLVSWIGKL